MRDLRRDRTRKPEVREEPLRATVGLPGSLNLSSWRGRSGHRYVVGISAPDDPSLGDVTEAVIMAVRRSREGSAHLVDLLVLGGSDDAARGQWLSALPALGVTEIHLHRLARSDAERRAVVADLRDEAGQERSGERCAQPSQDRVRHAHFDQVTVSRADVVRVRP